MTKQEMNKIQKARVVNSYMSIHLPASKFAYTADNVSSKHEQKREKEQAFSLVHKGTPSGWQMMLSVITVLAATGIAIMAGYNAKDLVVSLFDPDGIGAFNPAWAVPIAASCSILLMVCGSLIAGSFGRIDPLTLQKEKPQGLKLLGLIVSALVLVGFELTVAYKSYEATGKPGILYITGALCMAELVVGIWMMPKAHFALEIGFLVLAAWLGTKAMRKFAKITSDKWDTTNIIAESYNAQPSVTPYNLEETPNIQRARAYYQGYKLKSSGHSTESADQKEAVSNTDKQPESENPINGNTTKNPDTGSVSNDAKDIDNKLDEFLDDTDNNITV